MTGKGERILWRIFALIQVFVDFFWLKSCGICTGESKDFLSYRINSRKGNLKAASAWLSPKQTAIKGSTSEDS